MIIIYMIHRDALDDTDSSWDFVDYMHGSWGFCGSYTWFMVTPDHNLGSGDFIDHIQGSWGFSPAILLV